MAGRHARLVGIEVRVILRQTMLRLDVQHRKLVVEQGGFVRAAQQAFEAGAGRLIRDWVLRRKTTHWRAPPWREPLGAAAHQVVGSCL
jgi:hypothetical protein